MWTVACFAESKFYLVIKERTVGSRSNCVMCEFHLADVNECQDGNNGGCTDRCTNTRGSYQCSCRRGYEFQRDGTSGSGAGGVVMNQNTDAGRLCQG